MKHAFLLVALTFATSFSAFPQETGGSIDWDKARRLFERSRQGEALSPEDRAYLERARQLRRKQDGPTPAVATATPPVPAKQTALTDLKEDYHGQPPGLYGGGRNEPPAALRRAAESAAANVIPRDARGQPSPQGRIGLVSIGMSNTTQEFSTFIQAARAAGGLNPQLSIVDGAQGGQDARDWALNVAGRSGKTPWAVLLERLQTAGVSTSQVQVLWLKQALKNPSVHGAFPDHARELERHLKTIVLQARERFPRLRLIYLSSRTYGGYATTPLNPEPYAFESAFAVRWLIERQLGGDADLKLDRSGDPSPRPVLLWGPYLWTAGTTGRGDGLTWARADCAADGTHPSDSGRQKVADLLLRFFRREPSASGWFLAGKGPGTE